MAATRARTEAANPTPLPTPAKNVTAPLTPAATTPSAEASAPPRRTTTRTRKIPSRLLPSPSPPPSRPSSYHNPSKASKGVKDASASTALTPASASGSASRPKKSARHSLGVVAAALPLSEHSGSKTEASNGSDSGPARTDENGQAEALGLGKRKRKPSSMIEAPSTLTAPDTPTPFGHASKGKKRHDAAVTDHEQERKISDATSKNGTSSNNSKTRVRLSKSGGGERRAALPVLSEQSPYDSDGGITSGVAMEDSDLELDGAGAGFEHRSFTGLAGHRVPTPLQDSELSPPPLLSRCGSTPRSRMPRELQLATTFTKGGLDESPAPDVGYLRVQGPSQRYGLGPFKARGGVEVDKSSRIDSDVDSEQEDDEDDFHQAMLDGDFDMFNSQEADSTRERAWSDSLEHKNGGYPDDTPATTPRSPHSHCGMSVPDSPSSSHSGCKTRCEQQGSDASKGCMAAFPSIQDAVFAHALPTTLVGADKPHQHAGSLTLSLPYAPEIAASPRPRDLEGEGEPDAKTSGPTSTADSFATPIVSRRLHMTGCDNRAGVLPIAMKFGGLGDDAVGASQFLQLSPGIEMSSPLLSPTLGLDLAAEKTSQPTSPFIIGATTDAALEVSVPMSLVETEANKDVREPGTTGSSLMANQPAEPVPMPALAPTSDLAPVATPALASVTATAPNRALPKQSTENKPSDSAPIVRRTAHPPPRHISFTVRSIEPISVSGGPHCSPAPRVMMPPNRAVATPPLQRVSVPMDRTPDLFYGCGSTPSEASSGSASPASRADSDLVGDADTDTLLFCPPEKLDLRELDQVWGGSAQQGTGLGLKPEATPASKMANGGVGAPITTSTPAMPMLRRAKVTRLHHVDLTPN
ncbi:hypothetical protein ACQY0O_000379 [Thecaphora frezii]